jgi:hypothetical protein
MEFRWAGGSGGWVGGVGREGRGVEVLYVCVEVGGGGGVSHMGRGAREGAAQVMV